MLTNRINVTYNIENIDADFDIFRVEKSNKDYYKYNILDSAVYEFKAAAVDVYKRQVLECPFCGFLFCSVQQIFRVCVLFFGEKPSGRHSIFTFCISNNTAVKQPRELHTGHT